MHSPWSWFSSTQRNWRGKGVGGGWFKTLLLHYKGRLVSAKHFPDCVCTKQGWTRQPETFSINPGIARVRTMMLQMSQLDANQGIAHTLGTHLIYQNKTLPPYCLQKTSKDL